MSSLEELELAIKTLKKYEVMEIKRDKDEPDKVVITIKSTHRTVVDIPYKRELWYNSVDDKGI